jgi:hypothetical protein
MLPDVSPKNAIFENPLLTAGLDTTAEAVGIAHLVL